MRSVSVDGFAWKDGIRPGQEVISLRPADEPEGWEIRTRDVSTQTIHVSRLDAYTPLLRASWPLAALGLLSAVAAVASTSRRRMELLAAVALAACAIPIELRGHPTVAPFVSALAVVAPASWLIRWTRIPRTILLILGSVVALLLVSWIVALLADSPTYPALDDARQRLVLGLAAAAIVAGPATDPGAALRSIRSVRGLDLAVVAGLLTAIVVLHVMGVVPWVLSGFVAIVGLVAYARWRGSVVGGFDRIFLGDMRERASLDAIESERARLARDLHDEPLQQLAGVIKRLEARPETAEETGLLRSVADQLRTVATELHPPVLDDLGLVPSIEFIAARAPDGVDIAVRIPTDVDYAAKARPPANVELAVFRIAQEAVTNAIEHAGCSEIVIDGSVSSDRIDLRIADDGVGLTDREMGRAMRDGRLGLASMRRRAEAIDAELLIDGRPGTGTTVSLRWSA